MIGFAGLVEDVLLCSHIIDEGRIVTREKSCNLTVYMFDCARKQASGLYSYDYVRR